MNQPPDSIGESTFDSRLTAIAERVWPQLTAADEQTRLYGRSKALITLVSAPLALAGLIWLTAVTDLSPAYENWSLLLLLIAICYLLGQFTLWLPDKIEFNPAYQAQSTVIIWSAVLIFGPVALWLDIIAVGIDAVRRYWPKANAETPARFRFWQTTADLTTTILRETLPALIALSLYRQWGGLFPAAVSGSDQTSAVFLATWIKIALSAVAVAPIILIHTTIQFSPSTTLSRFFLFIKAAQSLLVGLIIYTILTLLGLLGARLYLQNGAGVYLILLAALFIVVVWSHWSGQNAQRDNKQLEATAKLEQLARTILIEPAGGLDLPQLLQTTLPGIFDPGQFEIRLFPDQVIYRNGPTAPTAPPIPDDIWQTLRNTADSYHHIRTRTDDGLIIEALALPINSADSGHQIGGLYYRPIGEKSAGKRPVFHQLQPLTILTDQIAATIHRIETYEKSLEAQTKAYKAEMYAQVFQAEMNLTYQRIAQELTLAGKIQHSFLPKEIPDLDGWQLSVTLESAKETSGDYYDFIPLPGGQIGILIADVADKGFGAALYMALSRTLIRTYALALDGEPAEVLKAANRRILDDTDSDLFVTVFYGVLDPATGQFTYCNSGHNPPMLWQSQNGNEVKLLTRTALPLGIVDGQEWEQDTVQIRPEDVLVLYTDGVTEAQDEDDEFFGDKRLMKVVGKNLKRPAAIIDDRVIDAIFNFAGDAPQFDDITLIVLIRDKLEALPESAGK